MKRASHHEARFAMDFRELCYILAVAENRNTLR
jgi:hypothetical protein